MSRLKTRLLQLALIAVAPIKRRQKIASKKILVIHQLLLGDTVMATSLLASIREKEPSAEIIHAVPPALTSLYESEPYGVKAFPYSVKKWQSLKELWKLGPFDKAFVLGDNRYSWAAKAVGSREVIALSEDNLTYRSWCVDRLIPLQQKNQSLPDIFASLNDHQPQPFIAEYWKQPKYKKYSTLERPYVLLHIGASSSFKLWPAQNWQKIAKYLTDKGFTVLWSGGPGEESIVDQIDPNKYYQSIVGKLDLAQLLNVIRNSSLVIAPDTGVAQLTRITQTPCISLFGPGSTELAGNDEFFQHSKFHPIRYEIACRSNMSIFNRQATWVKFCKPHLVNCQNAVCIKNIKAEQVINQIKKVIKVN